MVILYAEDDPDDILLFTDALKALNPAYTCIVAKNGYEAVKILTQDLVVVPDFIILDINMPLMGGWECVIQIKKNALLQQVPIAILSTSKNPSDKAYAEKLGVKEYLVKPDKVEELTKSLRRLFGKGR